MAHFYEQKYRERLSNTYSNYQKYVSIIGFTETQEINKSSQTTGITT